MGSGSAAACSACWRRAWTTTRSISSSGAGLPVQISNWRAPCWTKHLDPGDDGNAELAGGADERRVGWVIDEVEDQLGPNLLGPQDLSSGVAAHADRRGVDDDVEAGGVRLLREVLVLEDLGTGLLGELGGGLRSAVEDVDLGTLVAQPEHGGAA